MNIIFSILLLGIPIFFYSQASGSEQNVQAGNILYCTSDTVFKADLNEDGTEENITLSVIRQKDKSGSWISGFKVSVNESKIQKNLEIAPLEISLMLVDIDTKDKFREIVISVSSDPDGTLYYIYKFKESRLYEIASVWNFFYEDALPFPGNGKVYTNNWMGFWKKSDVYTYDADDNKLTMDNTSGIYDVNMPKDIDVVITVTKPIKLHKDRDDDSGISATLEPGTKINILKADINAKCSDSEDNSSFQCYWYYIESNDGSGWARLKDFTDSVEGLPWAG